MSFSRLLLTCFALWDVRSQVLEVIRSRHVPADLLTSALCDVQSYSDLDSDSLASLYDSTITELLDRQVPMRSVTCRRRPSSLWFDDECRGVKRKVGRLERAARRESPLTLSTSPTAAAWRAERRASTYHLRNGGPESCWIVNYNDN